MGGDSLKKIILTVLICFSLLAIPTVSAENNYVQENEFGYHLEIYLEENYNFECSCGETGHWEGVASGESLPRFFKVWLKRNDKKVNFQPKDAKTILNNSENNTVQQFLTELGKMNARAVSNLIVAYDPSLITFGGAVALNHPDLILPPIKEHVDNFIDKYYPFTQIPGIKNIGDNEEDVRNFLMSKGQSSENIAVYAHLIENFPFGLQIFVTPFFIIKKFIYLWLDHKKG